MNIAADTVLPVSLPTPLQSFIHNSRYARWLDAEQRRENWPETVDRYVDFFAKRYPELYPAARVKAAIQSLRCMPSMPRNEDDRDVVGGVQALVRRLVGAQHLRAR